MHDAGALLREARHRAGLTQVQLAARAGVTQPVVSRSEADGANPRVATLARLLRAAGAQLELTAPAASLPDVDEAQLLEYLSLSPAERLARFTRQQRSLDGMLRHARRVA